MPPRPKESTQLFFTAPKQVELRSEQLPEPGQDQVLVQTIYSAISPGTEMLVYRGEFPAGLIVDATITSLTGGFAYPLRYGYSAVGKVLALGAGVKDEWSGTRVFSFQPHASFFLSRVEDLYPIPEDIEAEEGVFLPNMETAVNFVMDGAPLIGERVAVLGQGVVGLLTTSLLARYPLDSLVTFDRFELRRQASISLGAKASLEPTQVIDGKLPPEGFDLVYELSGDPATLDLAIALCGFNSRLVIGSWYGGKRSAVDLGGKFHRNRIRVTGSQVSTIDPVHSGRWDKARRMEVAWEALRQTRPSGSNGGLNLITHTIPILQAAEAYRLIDEKPEKTIQVVLSY